jgi:sec-independent protein translocase protein TatA
MRAEGSLENEAFMGGLGLPELIVILVIVLIIFGGGKLPAIGDALGRSIRNFKKAASTGDNEVDVTPSKQEQLPSATANSTARPEQAQSKV